MIRLALLPISLLFACVLAGVYGAIHDQISFTVAPSYYHDFKFIQFAVEPPLQNRIGASIVGWHATWWMGILIGLPIYIAGLFVRGNAQFCRAYFRAALLVVAIALLVGLGALALSFVYINEQHLPNWMSGRSVDDPVAFARAGMMHNFSYLGGFVGLIAGVALMVVAARETRRAIDVGYPAA